MTDWVFWLIAALVLGVGEAVTLSFFLAPFAGGAALAALAAALGAGSIVQWAVAIVFSLVFLLVLRPIVREHRKSPGPLRSGAAGLVGERGVVVERTSNDEAVGCVKIGGEVWTSRAFDDADVFEIGERVEIVEIRGATALVAHYDKARELSATGPSASEAQA